MNDLFEASVFSTNCDLKLGSTRGLDTSEPVLAVSAIIECPKSGFVEGACDPVSSRPKSSAILSLDDGLGSSPLRICRRCGVVTRKRLAEDTSASWLGSSAVQVSVGFELRVNSGEDEALEPGFLKAPKDEACDDLWRMIGGLLLLAPVLATTTGFLLPDRWLLSPDERPPDDREAVDSFGIDTATSSLKRVVVDLRADLPVMGASGSIGLGSSSNVTAPSMPAPVADHDPWEAGDRIEELLDGRLEPELTFLSIGGGLLVVVRLFSFGLIVASDDALEGLRGVGVTEVSSNSSLD